MPDWLRAFKDTLYLGFEADAEECHRLNAVARRGCRYVPTFLAGSVGTRTFNVTRSAACASLLRPNIALLEQFSGLASLFEIEQELTVTTSTLEASLDSAAVSAPDFIELDTQGSELEILQGAGPALTTSVVGIQVEVEFASMYVDQPLFADVDVYLRGRGFELVDLSVYRARRSAAPSSVATRGQLLWGHARYLRNPQQLEPRYAARLATIAAMLDHPDFAAAALQQIVSSAADKALRQRAALALAAITRQQAGGSLVRWWRRPTSDARLRASVNRTTWRD